MNIVYAMTRHVYEKILPSIRSLKDTNPDANVYILAEDDELPFELPMPVTVKNVSGQQWFPRTGVNYWNPYTYINLLKVRYPTLLPELEKVIHLDIDTIITDSLEGMWETDVTDMWFSAVPEYTGTYRPFGDVYYNMGIALINLEQMRKDNIESAMTAYLNEISQPWADQDAWNVYGLKNHKIVTLDLRYNENMVTGYTNNPAIVHYCAISDWYERQDMFRVEYLNRYRR